MPKAVSSRNAPIEMDPQDFRKIGHALVERLADWLGTLSDQRVTPDDTPQSLNTLLGDRSLPNAGTEPAQLMDRAVDLLLRHSTLVGHPRFLGYICGAPAPIGALADLLASTLNPNVGGWMLGPIATEIEKQTIRWIAELIGYPADCGGLMVSGGNVANFVGFLAARHAKARWDVRQGGIVTGEGQRMRAYVSKETHTWIQKAADLHGLGTNAIRWIETDSHMRMNMSALRKAIEADAASGDLPFMVVGAAGSTAVGAVDPLPEIAALCREYDLWFHVDGAYGAPAAALPDEMLTADTVDIRGLSEADSVAIDPHKWLYAPLEAGCALVRDSHALLNAFTYHPEYYHFQDNTDPASVMLNYYEYGPQNSRGFRALKVWLALQQVGRIGYVQMVGEDIRLAREFFDIAQASDELEAVTHKLSVTTYRYVPRDLDAGSEAGQRYLNTLNEELLTRMQNEGEVFVSNAVVNGNFLHRLCVVNFRTSSADMNALAEITVRRGRELDAQLRPHELR